MHDAEIYLRAAMRLHDLVLDLVSQAQACAVNVNTGLAEGEAGQAFAFFATTNMMERQALERALEAVGDGQSARNND